jgi:hypothetical protein
VYGGDQNEDKDLHQLLSMQILACSQTQKRISLRMGKGHENHSGWLIKVNNWLLTM